MKKFLVHPVLILLLRLLIGGLFIIASIDKIAYPDKFAVAISNYHFLPAALVNLWALILPFVELLVGIFLVLGIFVHASALLSALMYLSFLIALSTALARGLDIGCGCFEQSGDNSKINGLYLVRDFSLLLASGWILFGYRGKLALESLWKK